jgi:hypothetical protein
MSRTRCVFASLTVLAVSMRAQSAVNLMDRLTAGQSSPTGLAWLGSPEVSFKAIQPGGSSLAVLVHSSRSSFGLVFVEGKSKVRVIRESGVSGGLLEWSADGRGIFFLEPGEDAQTGGFLVKHDVGSSHEERFSVPLVRPGMLPSGISGSSGYSPFLSNGGFESGFGWPWQSYGGVTALASSSVAAAGIWSLAETGMGGVCQDVSGLVPGQVYQVTARYSSTVDASGGSVLWAHDSVEKNVVAVQGLPSVAGWQTLTLTFVATSTTKLRVHLHKMGGPGTLYWDSVQVSQKFPGDFEGASLAGWSPQSDLPPTIGTQAHNGSYSISFSYSPSSSNTGTVCYPIDLAPNQSYTVRGWVRSAPGVPAEGEYPWISVYDGNLNVVGEGKFVIGWTEFGLVVPPRYWLNQPRVCVAGMLNHQTAIYWDDIEVTAGVQQDFDAWFGVPIVWTAYGGTTSSRGDPFSTGDNNVAQTGGWGGLYMDTSGLCWGQLYHISARARSSGVTGGQALLWAHDGAGNNIAADGPRTPSNSAWEEFAANFAATSTQYMRLHLHYTGGPETIYWDDVQVTPGWNDGFEGAFTNWASYGSAYVARVNGVAGNSSHVLAMSGSAGGVFQDIRGLTPGQSYRVFAGVSSAAGPSTQVALWLHDGAEHAGAISWTTPSATWQDLGVGFTATATGILRVHLHSYGGAGTVYWDNVRVVRVP